VNDEVLLQAFSAFGSVSEARVMWDMKTGRSRGYGFVAFRDRAEAEKALSSMDGEWLGSRAIRCNWANQKGQPSFAQQQAMAQMGITPPGPFGQHHQFPTQGVQSYDTILAQTPQWQTTCYVGNLTPYTTQNDLVPLFQNFGYVTETRFQSDRGFAFVKMDSHENAAMAICQLNGYNVNGRPLKCSVSLFFLALQELLLTFTYSGVRTVLLPPTSKVSLLPPLPLLLLAVVLVTHPHLRALVSLSTVQLLLCLLKVQSYQGIILPILLTFS
jgi:nucleolysin TIA-1/TIAR